MYLSQLILNPGNRLVLADLSNPYQMHRTVMSGFPQNLPQDERVLFRVELQRQAPVARVLVQSHTSPRWDHLLEKGYLQLAAEVKEIAFSPAEGQVFRFRLLANPTKRLRADGKEDGPRVGLFREHDQQAWLQRKGELHGFKVLEVTISETVQPDGWKVTGSGQKHRLRQVGARFDGRLQVTDAQAFLRAWLDGIGSGKGLGFGLLSLAPGA